MSQKAESELEEVLALLRSIHQNCADKGSWEAQSMVEDAIRKVRSVKRRIRRANGR